MRVNNSLERVHPHGSPAHQQQRLHKPDAYCMLIGPKGLTGPVRLAMLFLITDFIRPKSSGSPIVNAGTRRRKSRAAVQAPGRSLPPYS
jgi:hypothetical protein